MRWWLGKSTSVTPSRDVFALRPVWMPFGESFCEPPRAISSPLSTPNPSTTTFAWPAIPDNAACTTAPAHRK